MELERAPATRSSKSHARISEEVSIWTIGGMNQFLSRLPFSRREPSRFCFRWVEAYLAASCEGARREASMLVGA